MTESDLPMAGLRVLDIQFIHRRPAAAVVLGDWGADVIKIEGPDGDPNRRIMHDSSNYPKAEVNYPWQMDCATSAPWCSISSSRRRAPRSTS